MTPYHKNTGLQALQYLFTEQKKLKHGNFGKESISRIRQRELYLVWDVKELISCHKERFPIMTTSSIRETLQFTSLRINSVLQKSVFCALNKESFVKLGAFSSHNKQDPFILRVLLKLYIPTLHNILYFRPIILTRNTVTQSLLYHQDVLECVTQNKIYSSLATCLFFSLDNLPLRVVICFIFGHKWV